MNLYFKKYEYLHYKKRKRKKKERVLCCILKASNCQSIRSKYCCQCLLLMN